MTAPVTATVAGLALVLGLTGAVALADRRAFAARLAAGRASPRD